MQDNDDDAILALAETQGRANLAERLASGDVLTQHAERLLNLLVAGIAGALTLGRAVLDGAVAPAHAWAAAAIAFYWSGVAALLLWQCIKTRDTHVVHNEPKNLYRPESGWSLARLRRSDLNYLQERIEATKTRNIEVARWLDRCRMAAVLAPVVFVIVALAVVVCR